MYGIGENIDPEDYNDHTVYMADINLKRKIGLPQLTAGRIVCSHHQKRVYFGCPDQLLIFEDTCARLTLKEMEDVFDETLQIYNDKQNGRG